MQGSLGHLLTTYDEPNNHLFHSLLAHLATAVFGDGPLALRLPALLAGIALVPVVGLFARRAAEAGGAREAPVGEADVAPAGEGPVGDDAQVGGAQVAGLVAALFVAAAPPLIAYSANARGYSIALLLFVLQLRLSLGLGDPGPGSAEPQRADSGRRPWTWVAWVACGALAIWTVPTAVMGVLFAAIWLLAMRVGHGRWRGAVAPLLACAATGAVALALYAPVLGQRGFTVERFTAPPIRQLATTLAHAWTAGIAAPLIAVAVLLALYGLARRPRFGAATPLAVGLLAVPVTIAVLGRVPPYSRTYLFLLPVLAVLAGMGAARVAEQLLRSGGGAPGALPTNPRDSEDPAPLQRPAPVTRRARRAHWVLATGLAVLAVGSAAFSQTRAAWGEDPPGPPHAASVAATRALTAASPPTVPGLQAPTSELLTPPFTAPQLAYAASRLPPSRRPRIRSAVAAGEPGPWLLISRADVAAPDAIRAVGLDPAAVTAVQRREDPLELLLTRR